MVTRRTRDPKDGPSTTRLEQERALAAAMVAVWDSETLAGIAAALSVSIVNAEAFGKRYGSSVAFEDAQRNRKVLLFIQEVEDARAFLSPLWL